MWCCEITAWQRVSGLTKKVRCDEDFLLIHICHFYLNLWVNVLFSPTANFKILAFALQDIPLKPQIRFNIDILIISSCPRQQESCPQHRKCYIFWPLYISKSGNFSINEVLSVKAFWFWREQALPCAIQCCEMNQRYTGILQFTASWVGSSHTEGALNCFLKSLPAQGMAKIRDTWNECIICP